MTISPEPLLQVEGVSKSYGTHLILEDIHLHLHKGELVSLLGTSGGGKSTLFQLIAGLNPPDTGSIRLQGEDIVGKTGQVSYMFQENLLFPHKTVLENIALPLLLQGQKKGQAFATVREQLPLFGLEGYEQHYPHSISGGMAQRASLLRSYLTPAPLALLDEPFSALDSLTKAQVHQWFLQIQGQRKRTTLFITHDIDEALLLSQRIYLLCGTPAHIVHEVILPSTPPTWETVHLSSTYVGYKKEILDILQRYSSTPPS